MIEILRRAAWPIDPESLVIVDGRRLFRKTRDAPLSPSTKLAVSVVML